MLKNYYTFINFKVVCFGIILLSIYIMPITTHAQEITIYVDNHYGNNNNTGLDQKAPMKDIHTAIKKLSDKGGRIILVSDYIIAEYSQLNEYKHEKTITISSKDNSKLYFSNCGEYILNGPTVFSGINIYCDGSAYIYANFNPITFADNVKINSKNDLRTMNIYGGFKEYTENSPTDLDSHISIYSGDMFATVVGFTKSKGTQNTTFTGTSYINIYGGNISKIIGGCVDAHMTETTQINVYGGKIGSIYTGGNLLRCTNNASVNIFGGETGTLNINNVLKSANILLKSGVVNDINLSYQTANIHDKAIEFSITLEYNDSVFPSSLIDDLKLSANFYGLDLTVNNIKLETETDATQNTTIDIIPPQEFSETGTQSIHITEDNNPPEKNLSYIVYLSIFLLSLISLVGIMKFKNK